MGPLGGMRFGNQCRDDLARLQVIVVGRTIEVGRHRRDEVAAVLPSIGTTEHDAGDFGDGIPLVGRLERTGEERRLAHGLRSIARIDA
jgi:hypothetical protein